MAGLTDTGLEIKSLEDIVSEVKADIHGNVSSTLNLESTAALGQYVGSSSSQTRQLWEALQALFASWDPNQATGASLDRIAAYTGTYRRPATYSTVSMTLTLDAGTYAPGSLIVAKVGDLTARFSNVDEITTAGGTVVADFEAEDTGPVRGEAGLLTVLANPIAGFNTATNVSDAFLGDDIESNAAFRRRRELELALKGSTTVDAIRADLLQKVDENGIPLFDFVSVVENDTDFTVDSRPPHSFESMLVGGSSTQKAEALLSVKPAGIKAYGSSTQVVYDSQSNPHTVGWTVPTPVLIYLVVELDVLSGSYAGDEVVRTALVDYAEQNLSVGYDVIHSQLVRVAASIPGVVDAHVYIDDAPSPALEQNFVIGVRELAQIADDEPDHLRIVVNSTVVPGTP